MQLSPAYAVQTAHARFMAITSSAPCMPACPSVALHVSTRTYYCELPLPSCCLLQMLLHRLYTTASSRRQQQDSSKKVMQLCCVAAGSPPCAPSHTIGSFMTTPQHSTARHPDPGSLVPPHTNCSNALLLLMSKSGT